MKVILTKNVSGLGLKGEIKEVAEGHARNFLLPNKLAWPATESNVAGLALKKKVQQSRAIRQVKNAKEMAKKLQGYQLAMKAKADDTGKLYGSVNAATVAFALVKTGFAVSADQVKMDQPIKKVGNYPVQLRFDTSSRVQILVTVDKE